ncbi:receptor-type tyrosine-protein phosphatase mu-like, partial [Acanthaster planci]|uniref:protein-tyrosine-phosphatase n=1 Tax=Acanthaster planci TaxID=133434 RepID=A0A8B8A6G9_ACAPL
MTGVASGLAEHHLHLAMEDFGHRVLIILSVVFSVRGDTVYLTMVTSTPYGAGSSASISCFRSSPDENVTLSFGRPLQIGLRGSTVQTSTTLPAGSTQSVNGQAVTWDLTSSNDATGLFYCEGSNRNLTTRVYSIIHSIHRRFEPHNGLVTKTINKGEDVTLMIDSVNSSTRPLWHRNNNRTAVRLHAYDGMYNITIPSGNISDGDLYATIENLLSVNDNHFSLIRLIVRGCTTGRWGPPSCEDVCDMCYNGGVCNDETGDCICPPGFSGPNCLTACGMHKFGWNCEFDCGSPPASCNGQFGLPDPYGNSCISGYMGTYCNESCPSGRFGAGCTQICRCQAGDEACDRFTGECTRSGCQDGWSGTSCQKSSTAVPTPSMTTVAGPTMAEVTITPGGSEDSTTVSTATNPTPMSLVSVVVPVVIVLVLLLILVILLIVLVKRIRDKKHAEVDGGSSMQGKFESSNDLSSLQTIDNPISIPMEDINSNPNGDVVPETTPAIRPESSVSQISTLDSSSPFAGLPLYPTKERELKKDPIPLKDFVAYVRQAVRGHQLRDEWTSFPGIEAICSCDVSQLPDNKMKNRYRNIPAYDHCRVILEHDKDDPNLGYINACYIKGYKKDKAYIATQGPNQATLHDFWKMVWQENVHIIVNGTNLVEDGKNKCAKYWPDMEKLETFGGISISLVKEETRGEYEVRTMIMSKIDDNKSAPRKIRQYHYTTWPDKDVPKDVTPVLRLIKEFSDATPEGAGPYLIHCSAGVGRTGAIIAIHALLQQAHAEKTLDIYNFVADMRDHRVSIVQTPVQYTFIHLALLEALFSGDTCVPSSSLKKRVAELKKKKKMAEEFEQLNMISPVPIAERCRSSMMESNHNKNRLPSTLVPESCRPFLMTPREDGMEYNYINAAFVD